ncbi:MAG TPA: Crp/Fnr family transcriptional regulator [Methylomirabilota bacterium]|nr:Crp/Fnr family transcriptional regulator [Methylomirabilota bacterium]
MADRDSPDGAGLGKASKSCLAHQFAKRGALEGADVETLEDLEKEAVHVRAGERMREQGRDFTDLIVIRTGWASTFYEVGDGARQVIFVQVSGDIAGIHDMPYEYAMTSTVALTECVVCRLPRRRLMDLIERSPRIASILLMMQMQQQATLVERLVSLGCRSALKRTAHLLLELDTRRRDATFDLKEFIPLSQRQVADCLGLTDVHVNRCMRRLKDAGAIAVGRNRIEVIGREALERFARFDATFLEPSLANLGARDEADRVGA